MNVKVLREWKETRLKSGQRYVGLNMSEGRVYTCTSNGALRLTRLEQGESFTTAQSASLPMRLCDWRLSPDGVTFAYGGDEVELSVWNAEQAFAHPAAVDVDSKKRKRGDQLFPGEIWRAKNVPNDGLGLRQPVHVTALSYLQPSTSSSHHHLLAGTQLGNVRRYDSRSARRPVADWKNVCKIGGVSHIEKGLAEHEVFVADNGCNVFALDLRTGRVAYGYKGLSGAVTSLAPSPSLLASVSQDRFLRLHSTFPLPVNVGQQQEQKGEILDKFYIKAIPSAVVWDQDLTRDLTGGGTNSDRDEAEKGDDQVWDAMEDTGSGEDNEQETQKSRSRNKKNRATK
ncbi:hypothetical protein AcW1_005938 [Taiwanofungus camphoratus]|nr:hypothetical protein AcV5_006254 [Antrodia cinnamomea]KAI0950308.1 hypothetical protein AcV7_008818 [Antrodia cinnamomea]KAI0957598.1 hypothetical protein AcW1_005938 [Antrodia cinnamomea]